jgi:hypothetical protein
MDLRGNRIQTRDNDLDRDSGGIERESCGCIRPPQTVPVLDFVVFQTAAATGSLPSRPVALFCQANASGRAHSVRLSAT